MEEALSFEQAMQKPRSYRTMIKAKPCLLVAAFVSACLCAQDDRQHGLVAWRRLDGDDPFTARDTSACGRPWSTDGAVDLL